MLEESVEGLLRIPAFGVVFVSGSTFVPSQLVTKVGPLESRTCTNARKKGVTKFYQENGSDRNGAKVKMPGSVTGLVESAAMVDWPVACLVWDDLHDCGANAIIIEASELILAQSWVVAVVVV